MTHPLDPDSPPRRRFLRRLSAAGAVLGGSRLGPVLADQQPPALIEAVGAVPTMPYDVMSGDVSADRAILWIRTNRPARMLVDSATTASFANPTTIYADGALSESMTLDDGSQWRNRVTPAKADVAQTLADFRGILPTTCCTRTSAVSPPKSPFSCNGMITKRAPTGTPARSLKTHATPASAASLC